MDKKGHSTLGECLLVCDPLDLTYEFEKGRKELCTLGVVEKRGKREGWQGMEGSLGMKCVSNQIESNCLPIFPPPFEEIG